MLVHVRKIDYLKNIYFLTILKKFHFWKFKKVLSVNKTTNSMKVFAELGRKPLKTNIEI